MTLRVDIAFAAPLTAEEVTSLLLVAAGLPEIRRATTSRDRLRATWYANELPLDRVRAALAEFGLTPAYLASGLAPEEEASLVSATGERFRPVGR
ncbi:MAG: hypothetical protein AAB263_03190 [Planctomycetota bacterium]